MAEATRGGATGITKDLPRRLFGSTDFCEAHPEATGVHITHILKTCGIYIVLLLM